MPDARAFEALDDPEAFASARVVRALLLALAVNFAAMLLPFLGSDTTFHV